MFFDDRLATVLRQRATGEASQRTQFRQLLDLLGRERRDARGVDQSLLAAAWLRMDALAEAIPADRRARMIREPGWRLRNPDLAAHLADHEPEVAAAALTRADLRSEDWTALIPRLPVRARGFLRLRRDLPVDVEALLARLGVHDRGLPAPAGTAEAASDATMPEAEIVPLASARTAAPLDPVPLRPPASLAADDTGRSEISRLVDRIAQFTRERATVDADHERSPRLPLGEMAEPRARTVGSFGFAADSSGRIAWSVGEVAPMVIGARLFGLKESDEDSPGSAALARAFARRQPVAGATISLAGAPAIAGAWIVDAEPRFAEDGHFAGYIGRCRRVPDAAAPPTGPEAREADRIRQLLHELRTPVTAVQGYAEIIQQQLFGPAPHEYRALAAAIAADAARILAGFEELDRLARLETGALRVAPGETDLPSLLRRTAAQLEPVLGPHGASLALALAPGVPLLVALDPEDAEALVWRLMASLAAAASPGETLALRVDPVIGAGAAMARLVCALPARLSGERNLFDASVRVAESAVSPGLFGTGFALRLARAEARAAGGLLRREGDALMLTLPLLAETGSAGGAERAQEQS